MRAMALWEPSANRLRCFGPSRIGPKPGRVVATEFGKPKAEVYLARYIDFRNGLSVEPRFVDTSSSEALDGVTFAFVCVD